MQGPRGVLHVTYVRGTERLPATVQDPVADWRVDAEERSGLPWQAVVLLPGASPLVFESKDAAKHWAADTVELLGWFLERSDAPGGERSEAADEAARAAADAATERYARWAEDEGLEPGCAETARRAKAEGVIPSVVLFENPGCEGRFKIVPSDVGDLTKLVSWAVKSCWAPHKALLYANTWWSGATTPVGSLWCYDDLPYDVKSLLLL